ncbi:MAG: hypothetical protein WA431_15925 [Candidatus Cybelea sp.]
MFPSLCGQPRSSLQLLAVSHLRIAAALIAESAGGLVLVPLAPT